MVRLEVLGVGGGHDVLGHVRNITNFNEHLSSIVLTVVPPYSEASQEVYFPTANGGNGLVMCQLC